MSQFIQNPVGGSSGGTIGSIVVGGTAPAVLFVGAGDVLAQDPTNFYYDPAVSFFARATDTVGTSSFALNSGFTTYTYALVTTDGTNTVSTNASANAAQLSTSVTDGTDSMDIVHEPSSYELTSAQSGLKLVNVDAGFIGGLFDLAGSVYQTGTESYLNGVLTGPSTIAGQFYQDTSTSLTGNINVDNDEAIASFGIGSAQARTTWKHDDGSGLQRALTTVSDGTNSHEFTIHPQETTMGSNQILDVVGVYDTNATTSRPFAGAFYENPGVRYAYSALNNHLPTMYAIDVVSGETVSYQVTSSGATATATDGVSADTTIYQTPLQVVTSSNQIPQQVGVYNSNPLTSASFSGALMDDFSGSGYYALNGIESTSPTMYVENSVGGDYSSIVATPTEITLNSNNNTLVYDNNGNLRGSSLHNNATAQGNATEQDIRSGTYTPSVTNEVNGTATPSVAYWSRTGNVITVGGSVAFNTTVPGAIQFDLSLPVASNFSATTQAGGGAALSSGGGAFNAIRILSENTNDEARFIGVGVGASDVISYSYTYLVI